MPNIITGHNDVLIVLGATNGGWCVYAGDPDKTASEILETAPAAAVSDDEGLIEWFGEQLSLPAPELQARPPISPGPEAKPAEHGAPPVAGGDQIKHMVDRFLSYPFPGDMQPDGGLSFQKCFLGYAGHEITNTPAGTNLLDATQAEAMVRHMLAGLPPEADAPPAQTDIGELAAGYTTAILTLADVRKALKALVPWAVHVRDREDTGILWNKYDGGDTYAELLAGDLRNIMCAAGMFTDEMRPPEATAPVASTEQAGAKLPPATSDEMQASAPETGPATAAEDRPPSSAAPDAALAERIDMVDVGDGDDDGVDF